MQERRLTSRFGRSTSGRGWGTRKVATSMRLTVEKMSKYTGRASLRNAKSPTNGLCVFLPLSTLANAQPLWCLGLDRSLRLLVTTGNIYGNASPTRCPSVGRLLLGSAATLRSPFRQAHRLLTERGLHRYLVKRSHSCPRGCPARPTVLFARR